MRTLHPINDNILVRLFNKEEQTKGGIFLPESARTQKASEAARGEVVAVGPKVKDVANGETVITQPHMGTAYEAAGYKFVILDIKHVLAKQA